MNQFSIHYYIQYEKKISSGKNQNIIEHYIIYLPLTFPFCLISPPLMGHLSYLHGPNQNLFNFDHALYSVLGILIPKHMISMPWIRCFEYLNSIIFYHLSTQKAMQTLISQIGAIRYDRIWNIYSILLYSLCLQIEHYI